jgi:hypothetical protein
MRNRLKIMDDVLPMLRASKAGKPDPAQAQPIDIYNPHKNHDGPAAKLWELLRRNAAFRTQVKELVSGRDRSNLKQSEKTRIAQLLGKIDFKNPLAGYVLHWIFEAESMEVDELPDLVPTNLYSSKAEYLQAVLPHLDPAEAKRIAEQGFSDFCLKYPFYLRRDLHVFEWMPPIAGEHGSDPTLGHFWDAGQPMSFPGRLGFDTGMFNLNTPWPETPVIFQKQFRWLWAHYDVNEVSPFTGDRTYFPSAGPVNWFLGEIDDTPTSHERLDLYKENYFIFGVPLQYVYSDKNLDEVVEQFKSQLQGELLPWIGSKRLESTQKYPQLLGKELEWEVFTFCHPKVQYLPQNTETPGKPQRLGLKAALKEFRDWRMKKHKVGKEESHAKNNFERMEFLMNAVYPDLQFDALLWVLREAPGPSLLHSVADSIIPPGWVDEERIATLLTGAASSRSQSP